MIRLKNQACLASDSTLLNLPGKSDWLYSKFLTFSETRLLLPFNNSGAIHGRVPRTPPDTSVLRLILDNPKSPTCKADNHPRRTV